GLEFALNKYPDGKIVLSAKNKLTNELRNKLAKVIITELYALYGINNPLTIKKTRNRIANIAELHERTEARNEKLRQFGLTVQPFAVIVGDLSHPTYMIVVDEGQYKVDTGIRALELLFKLFHGLDIEYPPESEHIWLFIEELVFKLKPRKTSPSTSTVLADILYHMQE
ncbi:hypothetical protein NQ314_016488, partial [Rhamnusium bicolor]